MQTRTVGPHEDEPCQGGDEELPGANVVGEDDTDPGHPGQGRLLAPHRAAQQPLRLVDEPPTQMGVDDVGPGPLGIEGEWTSDARLIWIFDALEGPLPASSELRRFDQAVRALDQGWLAGQGKGGVDNSPDVRTGNVQRARAGGELLAKAGDLVAQITLGAKWVRGRLSSERVVEERAAEHRATRPPGPAPD